MAQSLAETAAKLVHVHYVKPASLGKPLLTIQQAIQADSFYDLSRAGCRQLAPVSNLP